MKIAFYKHTKKFPRGIFSRLIKWKTKEVYSHVELVFDNEMSFSSSERDGGTRFKKILFKKGHWDFIKLPDKEMNKDRVLEFCKYKNNLGYDWTAIILSQLFNFHINKENSWYCSEIVTEALKYGGFLGYKVESYKTSPGGLYKLLKRVI